MDNSVVGKPIEIIQGKLYWVSDTKAPQNFKNAFFFNIDNDLTYFPFNKDFGPLNLAMVHRFSRELARLIKDKNYSESRIFHYCTSDKPDKLVNGAFLMGSFMMIILGQSAEEAHKRFQPYMHLFKHYRDASKGDCLYNCTLLHCLQGLGWALKLGWYQFRTFNVKEYEFYERVENGDLNWIVPKKFVAFMGPIEKRTPKQKYGHHPNKYIEIFKNIGVTRVIRLNDQCYEKSLFEDKNIKHNDLFFIDGSTPPDDIVQSFLKEVDEHFQYDAEGAIAIHCKAGLGRTGTLIGLWAMKTYQIPADAFIGWVRIARPGSILGPQQFYLNKMEKNYINSQQTELKSKQNEYQLENSPVDKRKSKYGEKDQADYLILAKEQSAEKKNRRDNGELDIKEEYKSKY